MRIAFIGVGGIAGRYRNCLTTLNRRIAAVCDVDARRAAKFGAEEGASVYSDHRRMLSAVRPDAVFVCIPPGAHTTQVQDAAESGAAVFVARPVAHHPTTALRTREAIERAGVINAVGYHRCYSDVVLKAQRLIGRRRPVMGIGRCFVRMAPENDWWGQSSMSGGQIVEQSTDLFDLLRLFVGEVQEVQAFGVKHVSSAEIADFEECTVVSVRFTNGAVGQVTSACVAHATDPVSIELVGDDMYLKLTGDTRLTGHLAGANVDEFGVERGYLRQVRRFFQAIELNNQSLILSDYADATQTLAATLAATLSLRTGEPVPVRAIHDAAQKQCELATV